MFLLCLSERSGGNSIFINSIINLYLGSSQIIDCHQPIPLFLQYWTDFRLSWNKTEYDGISQLILNPDRAWLPDVMLINRSESYNFLANTIFFCEFGGISNKKRTFDFLLTGNISN